jgi:hypothetical protein
MAVATSSSREGAGAAAEVAAVWDWAPVGALRATASRKYQRNRTIELLQKTGLPPWPLRAAAGDTGLQER